MQIMREYRKAARRILIAGTFALVVPYCAVVAQESATRTLYISGRVLVPLQMTINRNINLPVNMLREFTYSVSPKTGGSHAGLMTLVGDESDAIYLTFLA